MAKAVLINSGGIDCRVVAAMANGSGMELHSIFIDWIPGISDISGSAAKRTADLYCEDHFVFKYPVDWSGPWINENHISVPYVATSSFIGSQYAHTIGAEYVLTGIRSEIGIAWRDALQNLFALNTRIGPKVLSHPVFDFTDDEVTAKAQELGIDLSDTWSCGSYPACRKCASCLRREKMGLV